MSKKITKREIERTRGGIKNVFCNGFIVCIHVGLYVYNWILSWGKDMRWVESWAKTHKDPPGSNVTWHPNIDSMRWLLRWNLSPDPQIDIKERSLPQRALELTFRADSLSDQSSTVKVLALQLTHWSHFLSEYESTAFSYHSCTCFTFNGIF